MLSTLLIALTLLFLTAFFLAKVLHLPKNIWVLFLVQPLAMSASPVIVFIGGILSTQLAPDPSLATLPLTLMIIGTACSTIPAAMLAKKWGRKKSFTVGLILSFTGSLIAAFAAFQANFICFLIATIFIGCSIAFIMQFRFAAIDSVNNQEDIAKVVAVLMFAGIFAAFIGPEIAVLGENWIVSPYGYAGSFIGLALLVLISLIIFQLFTDPVVHQQHIQGKERPLSVIMKQPFFIIAILASAVGYGVMSLLMTATPISMHNLHNYGLNETKWVIQSHITAMYLPSLLSGFLVARIGLKNVLMLGIILLSGVLIIAANGHQIMNYWWALVCLGVGWNFLFLTGTVLLTECFQTAERFKTQAVNDFIIFTVQALSSLLAGWILFKAGWQMLLYCTAPFIIIMFIASIIFYQFRYPKTEIVQPLNE